MNSPCIKDYNSYSQNQLRSNNKFNFSHSVSHLKKNHCSLNCKNPIKNKESEFIIVKSLWNDLGVNIEFQNEFKNYYNELSNDQEKMELLINEKNHLRKFRECLIKLSEEIFNRDENFFKLKKYCKELERYQNILNSKNIKEEGNKNNDKEEIPFDIFDSIQKEIIYYRINTVNVINRIMRVREISSYYELNRKWDPSNINRSYSFNKKYLLKMQKDIELINNSVLLNYIQTDNHIYKTDIFFSNCKYLIINENTKLKLAISSELQTEINKCKYILLQDNLLNNINREINKKININKRNIISTRQRLVQNTGSNFSTLSKKVKSEIVLSNDKNEKKYYEMFGHNKVNLSRTLYYLKKTMGNKYQKMFYNENDLLNVKRNIDIMNNFVSFPQTDEKEDSESNNDNNNSKEINIIDNNKNDIGIMEYSNKNKWNNHNMINSELNSNNNRREEINKNNEDLKLEKNIKYYFGKKEIDNNIKKKIKLKKKYKKEKSKSKEKTENNKNIKDKIKSKEKIIINSEKKEKESKIKNDKENKENKETLNSKKEIINKKFEIDNTKVENVININIIVERKNKDENNINDLNKEKNNEKLEKEGETEEIKKEEENEVESYINISQDHSKFSEDKYISKVKLLEYKQFTEEEIKKFNKNFE